MPLAEMNFNKNIVLSNLDKPTPHTSGEGLPSGMRHVFDEITSGKPKPVIEFQGLQGMPPYWSGTNCIIQATAKIRPDSNIGEESYHLTDVELRINGTIVYSARYPTETESRDVSLIGGCKSFQIRARIDSTHFPPGKRVVIRLRAKAELIGSAVDPYDNADVDEVSDILNIATVYNQAVVYKNEYFAPPDGDIDSVKSMNSSFQKAQYLLVKGGRTRKDVINTIPICTALYIKTHGAAGRFRAPDDDIDITPVQYAIFAHDYISSK